MDVVELVNKYGFPIVMAVGMGFIIKYVWTWATTEVKPVISLGGWSPHLQTGFHVSRPTCPKLSSTMRLSHTGLSPAMASLSKLFC